MLSYFIVTTLAVWLAALAGSRAPATADNTLLPRRRGVAAVAALLSGALMVAMAAFRFEIGTDYRGYIYNFNHSYRDWTWSQFEWDDEPGIKMLTWVVVRVHDDYALLMGLAALITVGLFMWNYAKYSTYFALSVLFFVLTGVLHGSFNGVRQYLAAAIVLAGHQLIVERKFLKYALVVGIATLFHVSALVLILLYFVPRKQLSFVSVAALAGAALLASYGYEAAGEVIGSIRARDAISGSYFVEQLNPLRIALAFVPFVSYLLFSQKDKTSSRSYFHINMSLVFAVLYLAAAGSAHLARFAIYAMPFLAFAIPAIILSAPEKTRKTLGFVLIVVHLVFWYIEVTGSPDLSPFRWQLPWVG